MKCHPGASRTQCGNGAGWARYKYLVNVDQRHRQPLAKMLSRCASLEQTLLHCEKKECIATRDAGLSGHMRRPHTERFWQMDCCMEVVVPLQHWRPAGLLQRWCVGSPIFFWWMSGFSRQPELLGFYGLAHWRDTGDALRGHPWIDFCTILGGFLS